MKYFCRLQLLSCNIDTVHVYCLRVTDNALRSTERIRQNHASTYQGDVFLWVNEFGCQT